MDEVEAILQRKYQLEGPYRKGDAKKAAKAAMKKRISEVGVDLYRAEVYKGGYLKKRGLVDQQLVINKKADFSYAQRKWLWYGEEDGVYAAPDLQDWYQVYD